MEKIPLTQGKFALVDDEDFARLNQQKWHINKNRNRFYAVRTVYYPQNQQSNVKMHREIMKPPEGLQIDHINHNGLDNRKCNLRICTGSQNNWNGRLHKNNTSGFKGVSWKKQSKKWVAQIRKHNHDTHLGYYFCIIKAAKAYDKAAIKLFGEFANTNFNGEQKNE